MDKDSHREKDVIWSEHIHKNASERLIDRPITDYSPNKIDQREKDQSSKLLQEHVNSSKYTNLNKNKYWKWTVE